LYQQIFNLLHCIINGEQHEKHIYNQSSHYENNEFLIAKVLMPDINQNRGCVIWLLFVTQSWETIPNRTSGKIKLTPPAYNHTTVL